MLDQMKQLMEMKRQADKLKRELEATQVESQDVRGIKIMMNGAQKILKVEIAEEYMSNLGKGKLESDLTRSFNGAIQKSQNVAAQKMKDVTGFNIPGL